AELSVFKLLDAFKKVVATTKADISLEVDAERVSIQERINEITAILEERRTLRFAQLFEGATATYDLVVSFLALLEMAKMRMVRIYQADPASPIHLEYRLRAEHDAGPEEMAAEGLEDDRRAMEGAAPDSERDANAGEEG